VLRAAAAATAAAAVRTDTHHLVGGGAAGRLAVGDLFEEAQGPGGGAAQAREGGLLDVLGAVHAVRVALLGHGREQLERHRGRGPQRRRVRAGRPDELLDEGEHPGPVGLDGGHGGREAQLFDDVPGRLRQPARGEVVEDGRAHRRLGRGVADLVEVLAPEGGG